MAIENGSDVAVVGPTIDELVAVVNREHDTIASLGMSLVEHAILAGEALLELKKRVPGGTWMGWTGKNLPHKHHATLVLYMRLAKHSEMVRAAEPRTVTAAYRLVAGKTITPPTSELIAAAREMRKQGLLQREIGDALGVTQSAVSGWLDPARAGRRRDARKKLTRDAKAALHRVDRDRAAKKAGGSIAESYALVRKALLSLEKAVHEEVDSEAKHRIHKAISRLHAAEDHIVRASKLSAGTTNAATEKPVQIPWSESAQSKSIAA